MKEHRIRSFVQRGSRITVAQKDAFTTLWPQFGLHVDAGMMDFPRIFGREAPRILEIGFGSGQSLLATAHNNPEQDFIGVETFKPGIGALLLGIKNQNIHNIRIYFADAVDVLTQCIPDESLDGVQIFFPDPWQKRRHHKRRLIQPEFVILLVRKLTSQGVLHLATDWENYAVHMMDVLSAEKQLINLAGPQKFALRSEGRPLITKFELRGHKEGRAIWELQFTRNRLRK